MVDGGQRTEDGVWWGVDGGWRMEGDRMRLQASIPAGLEDGGWWTVDGGWWMVDEGWWMGDGEVEGLTGDGGWRLGEGGGMRLE